MQAAEVARIEAAIELAKELNRVPDPVLRSRLPGDDFGKTATLIDTVGQLRGNLKQLVERLNQLRKTLASNGGPPLTLPPESDRGEMAANATLALRAAEDASMRLGKVIQAYDGGKSVYAH